MVEVRRLSCSVAFNGSTCFANVLIVQPQKHSALSWICPTLTEFRTSCFATMYSICSLSGLVKFHPSANSLSSLTLELQFGASHLSTPKNRGKEKSYLYFLVTLRNNSRTTSYLFYYDVENDKLFLYYQLWFANVWNSFLQTSF